MLAKYNRAGCEWRSWLVRLLGMVALAVCSGCADPKAATEANFVAALNAYFRNHPACITDPSFQFPLTIEERGFSSVLRPKTLDALAAAGLLTLTPTTVVSRGVGRIGEHAHPVVQARKYELTDMGKRFYREGRPRDLSPGNGFCYGELRVTAITTFTEPADMLGRKMVIVKFTYQVTAVAEWARSAGLQALHPEVVVALTSDRTPIASQAALILTNKGWVHEREFSEG